MNDHNSPEDLQQLRDRIAQLEAARDKPVKVEIEGLEGLKQWSDAIETRQLDRFYAVNSRPDMTNKQLLRLALILFAAVGLLLTIGFLDSSHLI
jgi:hypothetical protein